MDRKTVAYVAGVFGGYVFTATPVAGTVLSALDPVLDLVGVVSMVVFSGALIVRGVYALVNKI